MASQFPPQEVQNQCCFVASRGPNRGRQCGKVCCERPTSATENGQFFPVCISHVAKWRENRENMARRERQIQFIMQIIADQIATNRPVAIDETPIPLFDKIPHSIEISKNCCVCDRNEQLLLLPCQHTTCYECFTKIERKCPTCRSKIDMKLVKKV